MKKLINLFLIIILLTPFVVLPQSNYNKVGGIGFRVDDSQYYPENRLIPLDEIFNQRGLKFTYCVNFGIYISQALLDYLPTMQLDGDQIADHTPDHETRFFRIPLPDINLYSGLSGVDHISTTYFEPFPVNDTIAKVCLEIDHVNINSVTGEGLINISGNTVTSVTPNEFTTIKLPSTLDGYSMNAIYIPSLNKLFKFEAYNVTSNTITNLQSFWGENVDLGTLNNVQYHKVKLYDVFYTADALRVMAARTQQICDDNNIIRPTSWIQPGGYHPQFYRADLKDALESMGYFTAGVFADPAPPYYNSYDPNDDKRFGINWEDFNEEFQTVAESKNIIADRFAKHYVSIGHSHLLSLNPSKSFPDYLQRTADILDWCIAKGIPVKTYTEWAELLYKTPQNPYVNVMPSVDIDLDEDGNPDGFNSWSISGISNDGVSGIFNKSFTRNDNGSMFSITALGGVEKGENYFSIWIKGNGQIKVEFNPNQYQAYTFTSTGNGWQQYSCTFQVPTTSSAVDAIVVSSENTTGSIKIGGFELRGKILPPFLYEPTFDINTKSVPLEWEDNSNNEAAFRVKRMFEHENIWKTLDSNLAANSTNWVDSLLDFPDALRSYDFITVYYQIQASTSGGYYNIPSNIDSIRINTDLPLPVELSSFNANYTNKLILLDWTTETEVNNYGFEIERKTGTEWKKIGFVLGNGNSNSQKKYSFKDNNLLDGDKFSYRLRQIDNDGQFSYSNTVEVIVPPLAFELQQNYPNPFNPETKIRYQLPEKSRVFLKVFNSLGQEVATLLDDTIEPGNYEVDFNGSNLSSGVYYYRMQAGNFISTKKMIIIK